MTAPKSATAVAYLSWLIPFTYLIHIAEEYWGGEGYPTYIYRLIGVHFSPNRFLVAQGIGLVLVTAGIVLARQLNFAAMMMVILSATIVGNALAHASTALMAWGYNPGLLSSVLIWMPIGVFGLMRFKSETSLLRYWLAIAIGAGINVVIAVITMTGGRLIQQG